MSKRNFLIVFAILIIVSVLLMVGYSSFNSNISINGDAMIRAQTKLRITNVLCVDVENNGSNIETNYSISNATMKFNFTQSNSSIKYEITISNVDGIYFSIKEISEISKSDNINYVVLDYDSKNVYSDNEVKLYVEINNTSFGIGSLSLNFSFVEMVPYTLENKIVNGSFEDGSTSWSLSNSSIVDNEGYEGSHSLRFSYTSGVDVIAMSTQYLESPKLNHKYYGSVMFKSMESFSSSDNRYEWYYLDSSNALIVFARKSISTVDWVKMSGIGSISADTYLSESWKIRNFIRFANGYSYSDALILVDLTEIFGSGNEPSKEWCDSNIEYFDGSTIVYMEKK